jgi:hypothetical protein
MDDCSQSTEKQHIKEEERIKQLSDKSSQTLLFLSFALVVVATLKDKAPSSHQFALREAMRWWSWALFPIIIGVLPLKEFGEDSSRWYRIVRLFKGFPALAFAYRHPSWSGLFRGSRP